MLKLLRSFHMNDWSFWRGSNHCLFSVSGEIISDQLKYLKCIPRLIENSYAVLVINNEWRNIWRKKYREISKKTFFFLKDTMLFYKVKCPKGNNNWVPSFCLQANPCLTTYFILTFFKNSLKYPHRRNSIS